MEEKEPIRIRIPSLKQVTLRQFVDYKNAVDEIERFIIATGWSREKTLELKPITIAETLNLFENELDKMGERTQMFKSKVDGKELILGLIPDLNEISLGEYISMTGFGKEMSEEKKWQSLIDLFCVLYRPIKERFGEFYLVADYDTKKVPYYVKHIEQMPMYYVYGSLAFFLTISEELANSSIQYLTQQLRNQLTRIDSLG